MTKGRELVALISLRSIPVIVDALRGMPTFNAVQLRERYDVKTESVGHAVTTEIIAGLSDEKLAQLEATDGVMTSIVGGAG